MTWRGDPALRRVPVAEQGARSVTDPEERPGSRALLTIASAPARAFSRAAQRDYFARPLTYHRESVVPQA
jgi:hypothetical protein